jgi:DHA1 family inner membrane transport protein
VLLGSRVLTALSQALYWSVVAPTAVGLFGPQVRGRVTAALFGGISLAPMLGVPAGTWLGQQAGWRATFAALSGLGVLALIAVATLLPTTPPGQGHAATGQSPDRRRYLTQLVVTATVVTGGFTAYTYISPFLTEVAGFPAAAVGPLLLLRGLAGVCGIAAVGLLLDRNRRVAALLPLSLLVASLAGLYAAGDSRPLVVVLLAAAGLSMTAMPTVMQDRVMQVAPGRSDLASAGNAAAFNLGIAAGALGGGLLLPAFGVRSTALAGALICAVALVILVRETAPALTPREPQRHDMLESTR